MLPSACSARSYRRAPNGAPGPNFGAAGALKEGRQRREVAMNRGIAALSALALMGAVAGNVSAAKPNAGSLTVAASKAQVTYSRAATVSGQLKRSPASGQQLSLQQTPYPFNKFTTVATAATDAAGNYLFSVTPTTSTRYRVVTVTKPKITSDQVQVNVAIKVTRHVGDTTPARGHRDRFSGVAAPALAGRAVTIERRAADGSWKAVGTTTLDAQSKYAMRIRIRRGGFYRATVAGTDPSLLTGHSRRVRLRVH